MPIPMRPEASFSLRDSRGRKPTCLCGTCPKCKRREPMRLYMRDYHKGIRRPCVPQQWKPEEDALIGKGYDRVVAIVLQRSTSSVANRRDQLRIPRYRPIKGRLNADGYRTVQLQPDDPFITMARSSRTVMQHRIIMARHLGRPLAPDEFVHHKNGIKDDNRLENLELWTRSHPDGQRVADVLDWCVSFIERYAARNVFSLENRA